MIDDNMTNLIYKPHQSIPDPDYDQIPKLPDAVKMKKGSQCGQCGMKFEYGKAYGFCCGNNRCPMGQGPVTCAVHP